MPTATMGAARNLIIASAAVDAPSLLPLTAWWRNYSASPWVGTASLGTSGSNSASEATNPPTAGTALNGFTPAHFNGSNSALTMSGTTDTYLAPQQESGFALVKITADGTIIDDDFDNMPVWIDVGVTRANFSPFGAPPVVHIDNFVSGTWCLLTWRFDGVGHGTVAQIGINEVPGAQGGVSTATDTRTVTLTRFPFIGGKSGSTHGWITGDIMELAITDVWLTDQNFIDIKAYINTRYALSL